MTDDIFADKPLRVSGFPPGNYDPSLHLFPDNEDFDEHIDNEEPLDIGHSDGIDVDIAILDSLKDESFEISSSGPGDWPSRTISYEAKSLEGTVSPFPTSQDKGTIHQVGNDYSQCSYPPNGSRELARMKPLSMPPVVSTSSLTTTGSKTGREWNHSLLRREVVPIKAIKMSTASMIKPSKSDGLLSYALKARYKTSTQERLKHATSTSIIPSNGLPLPHRSFVDRIRNENAPYLGKANASWDNTPVPQSASNRDFLLGMDHSRNSKPSLKSSGMQDLLRQSKAQCRSQSLLRQSSAKSLSKQSSFQSIKSSNGKLDVSSLLPTRGYAKSRSASRRWSFPNAASAPAEPNKNATGGNGVEAKTSTNKENGESECFLHEACRLFPTSDTVVETALRVDRHAIRRSVVFTGQLEGDPLKKANRSMYGYPINIALAHGANKKVLKLLAHSGTDVLAYKDGKNGGASLGTALSSKQCDLEVVDILLSANQRCAQIADRRGNYPLHIAVSYGSSLDIIQRLYAVYPQAQLMRNFHSQTPIDIAIQSTRCPEEVMDFLRSVAFNTNFAEGTSSHAKTPDSDQSFGFLEDGLDDIMKINY